MATTGIRLLSPYKRRLYPNATSSKDPVARNQAGAVLSRAGWTTYEGPAQTDERGWIIPGTDPNIK